MTTGWGRFEPVRRVLRELSPGAEIHTDRLAPALDELLDSGQWRHWVHPVTGRKDYDDFGDLILTETRLRVEHVIALLEADGYHDTVAKLRGAVRSELPPLAAHGEIGGGHTMPGRVRTTKSATDDDDYVVARLKRDDPALATEVIEGRISPHAAAVKAGIRRARATFVTDDVDRAVGALLKHYDLDAVRAAIARMV